MRYLEPMNHYNLFIFTSTIEILFLVFLYKISTTSGRRKTTLIYDPIALFIYAATAIYILVPVLMVSFDWSWHNQKYSLQSYLNGNLVVFGYIVLVFIYYHFIDQRIIRGKSTSSTKNISNSNIFRSLSRKQLIILIIFFMIPAWLATFYLVYHIFSVDIAVYLRDRINLNRGKGPIILISSMGTILIPVLFANLIITFRQKKSYIKIITNIIFGAFIIVPFIIAYSIMGSRLTAFILLILLMFIYLTINNKSITVPSVLKLSVLLILIFVLFTFIGYLRVLGGDITSIDWTLILKVYGKELETALVSNFGNFEHLVWLIEHPSRWDAFYGQTFLAGFLNILPRSIFENKLLGGGPYLKNIIHPGSYAFSRANITSYTTGIAIETFMNFKYLGLLIVPFFHALALQALSRIVPAIKGNVLLLAIYLYLLFSVGFLILFGEFLGLYTRALIVSLPFILFYLFTKSGRVNTT